jgi:hypothetical protein
MDAASALAQMESLKSQLDKVADGLELMEQVSWAHAGSGENVKAAARELAAKAADVARGAIQICMLVDALPPPATSRRLSRQQNN